MGEAVVSTKHSFVPPNGRTRMYALGLHVAGNAKCNGFTAVLERDH